MIGDVLSAAAEQGCVPVGARLRMKLAQIRFTETDIDGLEALRDPTARHDAREELPRDFSAAADRMLLGVPHLAALNRIRPAMLRELR